jgi:hypothetical protein
MVTVLKVVGCGVAEGPLVEVGRTTAIGLKLVGCGAAKGTFVEVGNATAGGLKVIGLGDADGPFVEIGKKAKLELADSSSSGSGESSESSSRDVVSESSSSEFVWMSRHMSLSLLDLSPVGLNSLGQSPICRSLLGPSLGLNPRHRCPHCRNPRPARLRLRPSISEAK